MPTCPELLGHLERERSRITGAISELESSKQMLDVVISAARSGR